MPRVPSSFSLKKHLSYIFCPVLHNIDISCRLYIITINKYLSMKNYLKFLPNKKNGKFFFKLSKRLSFNFSPYTFQTVWKNQMHFIMSIIISTMSIVLCWQCILNDFQCFFNNLQYEYLDFDIISVLRSYLLYRRRVQNVVIPIIIYMSDLKNN